MSEYVGSLVEDVFTEKSTGDSVPGFDSSVATTDTIAAEHDQVRANVITRMLAHVVEGQPSIRRQAEHTLSPLHMKTMKKSGVSNARR